MLLQRLRDENHALGCEGKILINKPSTHCRALPEWQLRIASHTLVPMWCPLTASLWRSAAMMSPWRIVVVTKLEKHGASLQSVRIARRVVRKVQHAFEQGFELLLGACDRDFALMLEAHWNNECRVIHERTGTMFCRILVARTLHGSFHSIPGLRFRKALQDNVCALLAEATVEAHLTDFNLFCFQDNSF
jgi:hypothetical protein